MTVAEVPPTQPRDEEFVEMEPGSALPVKAEKGSLGATVTVIALGTGGIFVAEVVT